jgi:hypothetical protein
VRQHGEEFILALVGLDQAFGTGAQSFSVISWWVMSRSNGDRGPHAALPRARKE